MTNFKQLTKEHKDIILNLNPEELTAFLSNISKRKVNSLGFFSTDPTKDKVASVEEYNNFSGIEEDIVNIFVAEAPDKINKEYKRAVGSGLTVASDYDELKKQYLEQVKESKKLYLQKVLIEVAYISKAIIFNVNYLNYLLGTYYFLLHGTKGTDSGNNIELLFNDLIKAVYLELESYIANLELYKVYVEKFENKPNSVNKDVTEVISEIVSTINLAVGYIHQLEELKLNPFEEPSKFVAMDYIAKVFETDVDDLDSFKETLSSEEEIRVFNAIYEGFTTNIATYDFKNFCIIEPEGAVEE